MTNARTRHWPRPATLLAYGLVIATLSLLPGETAPQVQVWDKIQHLGAYLVFMLIACPLHASRRQQWAYAIGLLLFGGLIEIAQGFTPGRFPSMGDMLANGLGILCGALLLMLWRRWRRR